MTAAENTLAAHRAEYERGLVTRDGFAVLDEAEGYGAATTVGACSVCLAMLANVAERGDDLRLYSPETGHVAITSPDELAPWCRTYFPAAWEEHQRRKAADAAASGRRSLWQRLAGVLFGDGRRD